MFRPFSFVATLLGRRNSLRYYVQFLLVMCAKYLAADGGKSSIVPGDILDCPAG